MRTSIKINKTERSKKQKKGSKMKLKRVLQVNRVDLGLRHT